MIILVVCQYSSLCYFNETGFGLFGFFFSSFSTKTFILEAIFNSFSSVHCSLKACFPKLLFFYPATQQITNDLITNKI